MNTACWTKKIAAGSFWIGRGAPAIDMAKIGTTTDTDIIRGGTGQTEMSIAGSGGATAWVTVQYVYVFINANGRLQEVREVRDSREFAMPRARGARRGMKISWQRT